MNTVLLNGNPLLQYDGYYVLAWMPRHPLPLGARLAARSSVCWPERFSALDEWSMIANPGRPGSCCMELRLRGTAIPLCTRHRMVFFYGLLQPYRRSS